jgi:acyl-CoA thioester hydrolase
MTDVLHDTISVSMTHSARRDIVHIFLEMLADGQTEPVAAREQMLLHVDTDGR